MTTDIGMVRSDYQEDLQEDVNLLHHARILVEMIRKNASKPKGKLAIAMVEAPQFEGNEIAIYCEELLPQETAQYFRTQNPNYSKLKQSMCKILRPYMYDEDGLYHTEEMKALGIPTWLEVLRDDFGIKVNSFNLRYSSIHRFNKP